MIPHETQHGRPAPSLTRSLRNWGFSFFVVAFFRGGCQRDGSERARRPLPHLLMNPLPLLGNTSPCFGFSDGGSAAVGFSSVCVLCVFADVRNAFIFIAQGESIADNGLKKTFAHSH